MMCSKIKHRPTQSTVASVYKDLFLALTSLRITAGRKKKKKDQHDWAFSICSCPIASVFEKGAGASGVTTLGAEAKG